MTQHWASCSIVVCSLLALPQIVSATPAPSGDHCKQLQHTLDRQIDDVKYRQKLDRNLCELIHGRNSLACFDLKDQQEQELEGLRADRAGQMNGCNGRLVSRRGTGLSVASNDYYPDQNTLYAQGYNDYCKRHHIYPHPYPHDVGKTAPGVVAKAPAEPGEKSKDKNAHNAGASGTNYGSPTSGHGSNHAGTSASANHGSAHTGSTSWTTNSSGGGHSGGASSSYSGSSSSGSSHSSGAGGSSYSGSSYSGGSSSSSSSSAGSQNSGGGHPK